MNYLRPLKLLNRKKTDPNQFIYTGEPTSEPAEFQLFRYNKTDIKEKSEIQESDIDQFGKDNYVNWLNTWGLSSVEEIAAICRQLNIDNLVIQDILDLNQRPKFQEFENYSFLTLKTTVPSSAEMNIEQVSFVFGSNFLISFQEKRADYFDHLRFRLREKKGILREKGPDLLLYTMLEAILDNYFKTLNRINNEVNELKIFNLKADPSPTTLEDIERNKAFVLFIKNAIQPIREFVNVNERDKSKYIETGNMKYFLEIKDLSLTLIDICDTITASLESSSNMYFSIQGHKMNQVMKTLTVVATIFIPLTFVAGIYGMNFSYIPELQWKYGYLAFWILIISIIAGLVILFRKKKWF